MGNEISEVKYSLTRKISVIFFIMCFVVGAVLSFFIWKRNKEAYYDLYSQKATNCANDVREMLHGLPFDKFLNGEEMDLYQEHFRGIKNITNSFDLKYLYVYIPDLKNNKLIFIYDIEKDGDVLKENIKLGNVDKDLQPKPEVIDMFKNNKDLIVMEVINKYGHVITAYTTITDNNNKPVAIVGADIDYSTYKRTAIHDIRTGGLLLFVVLFSIYVFLILYVNKTFISPIMLLSNKMKNFVTNGKFRYSPIKLNTNDEFNVMAESYNLMAENIQKSMKDIFNSQMETIFSLAKLVQIKDDSTGKHIERVQAYCKIMAIAVMKAKLYPDIVDKTFIKNLVSASPLHDIGKVAIADMVLQNEKQLTQEEREKMQKHTIYGEQTLAKIHSRFGHNDFIKIGMSIARSHHEKWNGTGYPDGLKGEEIPLAARIAAIADVYDALATRRVYKPAFPHSKCVQIIVKDRGTHFDPQLVDLFIKIEHKFLKIRHSFEAQEIANYFEEKEEI